MKYSTFQKNACKVAEKTLEQGKTRMIYQNADDALYFTPDMKKAYYAYRLEGSALADQPDHKAGKVDFTRIFKEPMATGEYAERVPDYAEKLENGVTVFKYRTANGERENCFDRKLVRKFPENARFYLPAKKWSPAIVGLWENDRLNVIGCICPVRMF